jgi:hypothetical protein
MRHQCDRILSFFSVSLPLKKFRRELEIITKRKQNLLVTFENFIASLMKIVVFWHKRPCGLVVRNTTKICFINATVVL